MPILDIDVSDEAKQAELLGNLLCDMYLPRKVVDVGCNSGLYLAPFLTRGVEVMGYDNNAAIPATVPRRILDITKTFTDNADLTICLEVLEHIPSNLSDSVLDNLLSISNKLVFSAAQPGAGGVGHINCQPKEYWRLKIEERGFEYCAKETAFIVERMKQPGVMGWLLQNVMVFRKKILYPYFSFLPPRTGDVTAVVTSCGRFDLLNKTMASFEANGYPVSETIISDDSEDAYQHDLIISHFKEKYDLRIMGKNRGQAENLDSLYESVKTDYILHMEDDWEFIAPGAIGLSLAIMDHDDSVGLVQLDLRPGYFKMGAVGEERDLYYEYKTWRISEKHLPWHGWCGSPHLIRKSVWEKLGKFSLVQSESEYDMAYGKSGFRTVWAKKPYVRHIGYGRSTMTGSNYKWVK